MNRKDAKIQTMWVVKVRLNISNAEDKVRSNPGKTKDIWKEYEVEVSGEPGH